jgi:hypothetical protein
MLVWKTTFSNMFQINAMESSKLRPLKIAWNLKARSTPSKAELTGRRMLLESATKICFDVSILWPRATISGLWQ